MRVKKEKKDVHHMSKAESEQKMTFVAVSRDWKTAYIFAKSSTKAHHVPPYQHNLLFDMRLALLDIIKCIITSNTALLKQTRHISLPRQDTDTKTIRHHPNSIKHFLRQAIP
jgi:hypothetical protein